MDSESVRHDPVNDEERYLPDTEIGWTTWLATGLFLVLKSNSLADAKSLARMYLGDMIDPARGAKYIPYELRLRWFAAVNKKDDDASG